ERRVHLLHASALHERGQKRRRLALISVDLHAIGAQRVHDDQDDVLAAGASDGSRVRRAEYRITFGDRFSSGRWLEGESLWSQKAGDQFVLPEQIVAAVNAPLDGDAGYGH